MEILFSGIGFVWNIWHVHCSGFLVMVVAAQVLRCSLFHLSQKFFDLHVFLTTHITYNGIDMKYLTCFPFRKFQLFW